MNNVKLSSAISEFSKNRKNNSAYYEENWAERKERKEYYQSFTKAEAVMKKLCNEKDLKGRDVEPVTTSKIRNLLAMTADIYNVPCVNLFSALCKLINASITSFHAPARNMSSPPE